MKEKQKKELIKKLWNKLLFKKRKVDDEVGFDFYLSPLKWVGIVFAVCIVFIPFLINIILSYINVTTFFQFSLIIISIKIICGLLSLIYTVKIITWKKLVHSGAVGFYLFYFLAIFLSIINLLILSWICSSPWAWGLFQNSLSIVTFTIAIILILIFSPTLRLRFKQTIKQNYIALLIVGIFTCLPLTLFITLLFKNNTVNHVCVSTIQSSTCQTINTILFCISSIIIAPFIEELACRHGIFSLVGNKWLGFFTSVIYFAGAHLEILGNWNFIFPYLVLSLGFTLSFLYVRGNVTYPIFVHMLYNSIVVILMFIK